MGFKTKTFILTAMMILAAFTFALAASPYAGSYSGSFSGAYAGDWTCTVAADGSISDFKVNLAPKAVGSGKVTDDGKFAVSLTTNAGEFNWTGTVDKSLKASGEWELGEWSGQGKK